MLLIPDKKSLRIDLRAIRKSMASAEKRRNDHSMRTTLFSLPEFQRSNTVFCYLGLIDQGELDTSVIIDLLHSSGKTVVAPFVVAKGIEPGTPPRMEARLLHKSTSRVTSDWGLIEPNGTDAIDPEKIDLSIVPCLGVTLNGDRIGKGKGFYDRYLEQVSAPAMCLCYEGCIVDPFHAEEHDKRMNVIITERRLVRIV